MCFIVCIKTDGIYKDISEDVNTRFDTSNYELDGPLAKGKNMVKYFGLKAKTYSYLIDDSSEDKKAKATKMYVIERKLKFEYYKNCLEATQLENKINHLEKTKIDIDRIKENHK